MITVTRSGVLQYVARVAEEVAKSSKHAAPVEHLSQAASDLIWGITRLDADRDGRITDEDLEMLVELAFGFQRANLPSTWASLKESWRVYDGTLQVKTVLEGVQDPRVLHELAKRGGEAQFDPAKGGRLGPFTNVQEYVRCFQDYDGDANGVICPVDLKFAVANKIGLRFNRERCREIILKVDTDGDGVVGLNDFGLLIMQLVEEEEEYNNCEDEDPCELDFEEKPWEIMFRGA